MTDEVILQERYLRDTTPRRLGNLASSVKRLGRFISMSEFDRTVHELAQECRLFARWAASEVEYETSLALRELQTDLETWQKFYAQRKGDENWRASINHACTQWSQRLLELSGLLNVKPETLPR